MQYDYLLFPELPSLQGLSISLNTLLSEGWEMIGEVPIQDTPPRNPPTIYHELCRESGGEPPRGFIQAEITNSHGDTVRVWIPSLRPDVEIAPELLDAFRLRL